MTEVVDALERFVQAQDPVFGRVLEELRAGQKRSHWMWFIFPQIAGLGRSPIAHHYAIASRGEAEAYVAHAVLGPRLVQCTHLVLSVQGRSVHEIFGSPDDLKFHSSMTLFAAISGQSVFKDALARWFGGCPDRLTLPLLAEGGTAGS